MPTTTGFICHNLNDFDIAIQELEQNTECKLIVFKELSGASGKGLRIIDNKNTLRFIRSLLARRYSTGETYECLIEQWHETKININYQIFIADGQPLFYIPPKKQILNGTVYIGSEFPISSQLEYNQMIYLQDTAEMIGNELKNMGYEGLVSIDAIITNDDLIIPIIEINARASLSTYISFLSTYIGENMNYASRYYTLPAEITLEDIEDKLYKYRYSQRLLEGVMIYSFCQGVNESSYGRIFLLSIAQNPNRVKELSYEVEQTILSIYIGRKR